MLKESPLIEEHRQLKARFINFHGWKLPLTFSSPAREHLNVREHSGLFDVSHLGDIRVQGPGALQLLQKCLTSDASSLQKNQSQYSLICNERGGILDDLILYCFKSKEDYLLCVNASCLKKDLNWLNRHNSFGATLRDESDLRARLALQGPSSRAVLSDVFSDMPESIKKNHFKWRRFESELVMVSATGYTGEKGFEILSSPSVAVLLWRKILTTKHSCLPVGLAARDTLRMEMKYPLYGQDINEHTDPYSAGLGFAVKNPEPFIGSSSLLKKQVKKKWVGFQLRIPSGVPRKGHRIFVANKPVGEVTGGAGSPSLNKIIGLGYLPKEYSRPCQRIQVEIHGNLVPAEIVATPFIKRSVNK